MYLATIILTIFFVVFWLSEIGFVRKGIRWTKKDKIYNDNTGVTVIKPIKDLDFQLEDNLISWLSQSYKGPIQYIFSFQEKNDPAIRVVEKLKENFPDKDIMIICNDIIEGLNGKSSNMKHGVLKAKHDILVFGDSDTRVLPTFISKMVGLLNDPKTGVASCAQMNVGGRDFWTRFFTYIQNCETVFHWSFLTRVGVKVGANGAAFAIKRSILEEIGGIESFGSSLLEDMLLGNLLTERGYKVKVGPFIECYQDVVPKDKVLNYMRRSTIGFRTLIKSELPLFIFMLSWYWVILVIALALRNTQLIQLSLLIMGIRTLVGLEQRWITEKKILPVDIVLPLFFDLFGTLFILASFHNSTVVWRGIEYRIKVNGNIEIINDDFEEYSKV